jgi:hypothetical protein
MYRDTQADQVVICGLRHHAQLHGFGYDFFFLNCLVFKNKTFPFNSQPICHYKFEGAVLEVLSGVEHTAQCRG